MPSIQIDRAGIDECYQSGLVKPNEFRQIYVDKIEKEISLRLENLTCSQKFQMFICWITGKDWILQYYQELSDSKDTLFECIINVAGSNPTALLLDAEESKLLFLASIFNKKALLVRECSDLLNHPLAMSSLISVNKETLRAIDYLRKYVNGGKAVLKTLEETEQ